MDETDDTTSDGSREETPTEDHDTEETPTEDHDTEETPSRSGDGNGTGETNGSTDTTTGPLTTVIDTVTPPYVSRRDVEMDALAWGAVALVVVVLFPFLPILVAGWGILKLIELLADRG